MFFEKFFFVIYRFDESGSLKISSKLLVDLALTFAGFDFEALEDFVDASLKISSKERKFSND